MNYLDSYTQRIEGTGNIELAESIRTASKNFYSKYLSKFQFNEHQVGLLLGMFNQEKPHTCSVSSVKLFKVDFKLLYY